MATPRQYRHGEPLPVLLAALTRTLTQAWHHAAVAEIMSELDELPEDLRPRARAWLLSQAPQVEAETLGAEVLGALATRTPTADDQRLVKRLVDQGAHERFVEAWKDVLGPAPDVGRVARGLAEGAVEPAWTRAREWSGVLPVETVAPWTTALAVLTAAFGPVTDIRFERLNGEAAWGRSPMTLEEVRALPVLDAAQAIAHWRPGDAEWLVSARELGRVLEDAVKADPASWGATPVQVAVALKHPTYLAHYLRGLAQSNALDELDLEAVTEVLELVAAHPWEVVPLGRDDGFEYDRDWSEAERAGVALIKATAEADCRWARKPSWQRMSRVPWNFGGGLLIVRPR